MVTPIWKQAGNPAGFPTALGRADSIKREGYDV
jgi:hypothetical protein